MTVNSVTRTLGELVVPVDADRQERRRQAKGRVLSSLSEQFPARRGPDSWPATRQASDRVLECLSAPPFALPNRRSHKLRQLGVARLLDWLQAQDGDTWQQRWIGSAVETMSTRDWKCLPAGWLKATGQIAVDYKDDAVAVRGGLLPLICADVLRPGMGWLLTAGSPRDLAAEMARTRDREGFTALAEVCRSDTANKITQSTALRQIAVIMSAKGGAVADITVGDCIELLEHAGRRHVRSPYFYQLLHAVGVFPAAAPATIRVFNAPGQRSVENLIDGYGIECRPIRDLLIDYLRERQPGIDYRTLRNLAYVLGRLFWRDLELHHPGIDSLRLSPQVAAAWKARLAGKTVTSKTREGHIVQTRDQRTEIMSHLTVVRAFYLDLAHWAADDPARWGPWSVPSPVRAEDLSHKKNDTRRKSRMDQRTRERMPLLPKLVASAEQVRADTRTRLDAATNTEPGQLFTAAGQTLRRSVLTGSASARIWAEDPDTGQRRDLSLEEHRGFWAWATVEVLRLTGIRIEELTELSHHSLIQYRIPATGELIPLLQIAPSKTDEERLLVVSPELADVLSTVIRRIRNSDGSVPLVVAYDEGEKVWNPPMPLLFQRRLRADNRPISQKPVRDLLNMVLAHTGLTDASGRPLKYQPHDFRRIWITDAILHGMPPHIAQLVAGHRDINTTMGYNAVYPEEVINGHRAFIARRRALRPSEEYRTPTDDEWDEFLGHFERRRVALGDCGRSYASSCIHEHSCLRCPLLRPNPDQRPRIVEIRDNLLDRIAEAEREGWAGEVEGLKVSLAGAKQKLAQLDEMDRRATTVHLGIPTFGDVAGRNVTTPEIRFSAKESS